MNGTEEVDIQALLKELAEEKQKRQALEVRLNEIAEEGAIRAELQRLGVAKVDLAYKAVRGDLANRGTEEMKEYLARFVAENPELLPPRLSGGSGASAEPRSGAGAASVDLEKIRPGMSGEELDRIRQEIARVASLTLRGI
jgi:hypothetical protein